MNLSAIQGQFGKAAKDDPALQQRPFINVELLTFHQILKPIEDVLAHDTVYGGFQTDVSHQVQELRQMCHDAQAGHTAGDNAVNEGRNNLLNTLQGVLESVQNSHGNLVSVDFEDLYALPQLTDVIRGNAKIYREYMNEAHVADALDRVAQNIDMAQANLWEPSNTQPQQSHVFETGATAVNDEQDILPADVLDEEYSHEVA